MKVELDPLERHNLADKIHQEASTALTRATATCDRAEEAANKAREAKEAAQQCVCFTVQFVLQIVKI